jgi:toxin ParE1/3/4
MPGVGRGREELGTGLRSFAVGKYIVFYRAVVDGIEVARILSGYRDIKSVFRS